MEQLFLTKAQIAQLPEAIARSKMVHVAGGIPIIETAMRRRGEWRTLPAAASKAIYDKYSTAEDAPAGGAGSWCLDGSERSTLIEGIWCNRMVQSGADRGLIRIGWVRRADLRIRCSEQFQSPPPQFWVT